MWEWFSQILIKYPEAAVYLSVGIGFIVGKIKIGFFSLGTVASALLVGLLIGQIGVVVTGPIRSAFFLLFLFTTGYAVGPQFFQSLRSSGIKQIAFAACVCLTCFISTFIIAKLAGYHAGQAGGLFAGAQTTSAALGVVPETIASNPNIPEDQKKMMIDFVPICYSLTYIFGAAGSAFILSIIGPRLLGGIKKVREEVDALEHDLGDQHAESRHPAFSNALRAVTYRAYHVTNEWFVQKDRTVLALEERLAEQDVQLFVARIRHDNIMTYPEPRMIIYPEDDIVLSGRREYAVDSSHFIGTELADYALLNFPTEHLPVLLKNKSLMGQKVSRLLREPYMHGVSIRKIARSGINVRVRLGTELLGEDVITITGTPSQVQQAAKHIGYADRATNVTDIIFLCIGLVAGIYFGSLLIKAGKIPISLGSSGGCLLAGIILGWLRSKRPTFGAIPEAAVWVMRTLGLSMYVAIIGISAAPSFSSSLQELGFGIIVSGALATTIPLIVGILLGKYVFKLKAPILLGCIAGARTSTPSLGAVTDQLKSDLPTLGYSVTYAVGVIVNLIGALLLVLLI